MPKYASGKAAYAAGAAIRRRNKRATWKKTTRTAKKQAVPTAKAMRSIAAQVMKNKANIHGNVQTNLQQTTAILDVSNDEPAMFDLTDFTAFRSDDSKGCAFYQWAELVGEVAAPAHWTRANFNNNPFHSAENLDIVNGGVYKPISTKITFRVTWDGAPTNKRVSFHVFTQKPGSFVPNLVGEPSMTMPSAIQYLKDMANPVDNQFSRTYFKLIKRRTLFFNAAAFERSGEPDDDADEAPPTGTTGTIKYCTFYFGKKFFGDCQVRQRITRPAVGPSTPVQEVGDGNYGPANRILGGKSAGGKSIGPYYILISTDNTRADVVPPQISAIRRNYWRDETGQGPM